MRLVLTDNNGTMLDSVSVSAGDFRLEVLRSPAGALSWLDPGNAALDADDTADDTDAPTGEQGKTWCGVRGCTDCLPVK